MAPYIRVGKYIVKKKIGEGAFAEVRLAIHEETKIEYAVKVFNRSLLQRNRFESDVKKEIRIMQHLRHPNIVSIHAVLVTASKMYLVMEYVRGGELYDEIVSSGRIDEETSRHYFQQLVDAMVYCHRRGVVHRDLKPENLLLDGKGNIKVADFGMSFMKAASQDSTQVLLSTQCGTPKYMAPEVIMRPPEGYDGQKLDVWECGMVLYALLAGFLPFHGDDDNTVFRSILSGRVRFPSFFSPGAKDILRILLEKDPSKRASLEEVKQHPWFLVNYEGDQSAGYPELPRTSCGASRASLSRPPKLPTSPVTPRNENSFVLPRDSAISQQQEGNHSGNAQEAIMSESRKLQNEKDNERNPSNQSYTKLNPPSCVIESSKMQIDVKDQEKSTPRHHATIHDDRKESRKPIAMNRLRLPDSTRDTSLKDGDTTSEHNTGRLKKDTSIKDTSNQLPQPASQASTIDDCNLVTPLSPVSQWRENVRLDLLKLESEPVEPQLAESPLAATPAKSQTRSKKDYFATAQMKMDSTAGGDEAPRTFSSPSYRFPKSFKSFITYRGGDWHEREPLSDRENDPSPSPSITSKSMKSLLRNLRSLGSASRLEINSAPDEHEENCSWFTARGEASPTGLRQGPESQSSNNLKATNGVSEDLNKVSAASPRLNGIPATPTSSGPSSASKSSWRIFQRPAIFR